MGVPIWNDASKSYKQETVKNAELDNKGGLVDSAGKDYKTGQDIICCRVYQLGT